MQSIGLASWILCDPEPGSLVPCDSCDPNLPEWRYRRVMHSELSVTVLSPTVQSASRVEGASMTVSETRGRDAAECRGVEVRIVHNAGRRVVHPADNRLVGGCRSNGPIRTSSPAPVEWFLSPEMTSRRSTSGRLLPKPGSIEAWRRLCTLAEPRLGRRKAQ